LYANIFLSQDRFHKSSVSSHTRVRTQEVNGDKRRERKKKREKIRKKVRRKKKNSNHKEKVNQII